MVTTGRPRTFDRAAALDAAMELFRRQGYQGSSLDDLLAVMGIGRSSFYAAFESKPALFREALDHYRAAMETQLRLCLTAAPSIRGFIAEVFAMAVAEATVIGSSGCLVMNSAVELGAADGEFTPEVRSALAAFDRVFADAIRQGQRSGELSQALDPDLLGVYLSSTLGGLRTLAKVGTSPDRIAGLVTHALRVLDDQPVSAHVAPFPNHDAHTAQGA